MLDKNLEDGLVRLRERGVSMIYSDRSDHRLKARLSDGTVVDIEGGLDLQARLSAAEHNTQYYRDKLDLEVMPRLKRAEEVVVAAKFYFDSPSETKAAITLDAISRWEEGRASSA